MPTLTPAQQHQIGHGDLLLDQMTRSYIREHLGYRFAVYADAPKRSLSSTPSGVVPCGRGGRA